MIEAIAKAIYESRNGKGCKAWAHLPKAHQEPYRADARAAVEVVSLYVIDALTEAAEYFDNRSDADCDQDGYIPNEEMKISATIEAAIQALERACPDTRLT